MGDGASGLPSSSGILSQNAAMQLLRPLLQAPALSTPNDRTQVPVLLFSMSAHCFLLDATSHLGAALPPQFYIQVSVQARAGEG